MRDKVIGVVEKYTDAVRRNDDKTNDVDVLHDSRERFKGSAEGFSTLIGIHGKYTDHIRMKRKVRWVLRVGSGLSADRTECGPQRTSACNVVSTA